MDSILALSAACLRIANQFLVSPHATCRDLIVDAICFCFEYVQQAPDELQHHMLPAAADILESATQARAVNMTPTFTPTSDGTGMVMECLLQPPPEEECSVSGVTVDRVGLDTRLGDLAMYAAKDWPGAEYCLRQWGGMAQHAGGGISSDEPAEALVRRCERLESILVMARRALENWLYSVQADDSVEEGEEEEEEADDVESDGGRDAVAGSLYSPSSKSPVGGGFVQASRFRSAVVAPSPPAYGPKGDASTAEGVMALLQSTHSLLAACAAFMTAEQGEGAADGDRFQGVACIAAALTRLGYTYSIVLHELSPWLVPWPVELEASAVSLSALHEWVVDDVVAGRGSLCDGVASTSIRWFSQRCATIQQDWGVDMTQVAPGSVGSGESYVAAMYALPLAASVDSRDSTSAAHFVPGGHAGLFFRQARCVRRLLRSGVSRLGRSIARVLRSGTPTAQLGTVWPLTEGESQTLQTCCTLAARTVHQIGRILQLDAVRASSAGESVGGVQWLLGLAAEPTMAILQGAHALLGLCEMISLMGHERLLGTMFADELDFNSSRRGFHEIVEHITAQIGCLSTAEYEELSHLCSVGPDNPVDSAPVLAWLVQHNSSMILRSLLHPDPAMELLSRRLRARTAAPLMVPCLRVVLTAAEALAAAAYRAGAAGLPRLLWRQCSMMADAVQAAIPALQQRPVAPTPPGPGLDAAQLLRQQVYGLLMTLCRAAADVPNCLSTLPSLLQALQSDAPDLLQDLVGSDAWPILCESILEALCQRMDHLVVQGYQYDPAQVAQHLMQLAPQTHVAALRLAALGVEADPQWLDRGIATISDSPTSHQARRSNQYQGAWNLLLLAGGRGVESAALATLKPIGQTVRGLIMTAACMAASFPASTYVFMVAPPVADDPRWGSIRHRVGAWDMTQHPREVAVLTTRMLEGAQGALHALLEAPAPPCEWDGGAAVYQHCLAVAQVQACLQGLQAMQGRRPRMMRVYQTLLCSALQLDSLSIAHACCTLPRCRSGDDGGTGHAEAPEPRAASLPGNRHGVSVLLLVLCGEWLERGIDAHLGEIEERHWEHALACLCPEEVAGQILQQLQALAGPAGARMTRQFGQQVVTLCMQLQGIVA